MGAVREYVQKLKGELAAMTNRAVTAEGEVSHWKAMLNAERVNNEANWSALTKNLALMSPTLLEDLRKANLIKE